MLGEQAWNEHSAVHKRIRVVVEIGGVSWAWQRLWILQILRTYCGHIADILQIVVESITGVSHDSPILIAMAFIYIYFNIIGIIVLFNNGFF